MLRSTVTANCISRNCLRTVWEEFLSGIYAVVNNISAGPPPRELRKGEEW